MEAAIAYFCKARATEGKRGEWESWFSIWGRKQSHGRWEHEVGIPVIQQGMWVRCLEIYTCVMA